MIKPIFPGRYFKKDGLLYSVILIILFAVAFSSCKVPQNAYYFKTLKKDTTINSAVNRGMELKIQKNDLLSINISSLKPTLSQSRANHCLTQRNSLRHI